LIHNKIVTVRFPHTGLYCTMCSPNLASGRYKDLGTKLERKRKSTSELWIRI